MIKGSCLCGGVKFQIRRAVGPFELCHCARCRKVSGSAFLPWLGVLREDFQFTSGRELIRSYEAPLRDTPPAYRTSFCSRCGSQVPDPDSTSPWFEIPPGALDDDPDVRPDKHIYVDTKSPWYAITDELPQLKKTEIRAFREAHPDPR